MEGFLENSYRASLCCMMQYGTATAVMPGIQIRLQTVHRGIHNDIEIVACLRELMSRYLLRERGPCELEAFWRINSIGRVSRGISIFLLHGVCETEEGSPSFYLSSR